MKKIPPMRIKWGDFTRVYPLQRIKVSENSVRESMLDWINWHKHAMAWWNEPHGAVMVRGKRIRTKHLLNKYNRTGVPDILGSWRERPLAIEVKRPATKLQGAGRAMEGQIEFIKEAREKGWIAFFAYTIDDVKMQLQEFEQYYWT